MQEDNNRVKYNLIKVIIEIMFNQQLEEIYQVLPQTEMAI
jgi:hypothetical protein